LVRSIGEQLGARAVRRQVEPRLQWRDPRLHHLASALGAELEADAPSDPLYAESLCTALVVQLLTGDHALVTDSRTLAPRVAARVVDYIESHLHQRLTLADLAAEAGLSVPYFKALFRAAPGGAGPGDVARRALDRHADRAGGRLCAPEPHDPVDEPAARPDATGHRERRQVREASGEHASGIAQVTGMRRVPSLARRAIIRRCKNPPFLQVSRGAAL
jgi:AcrR family transcriptional regulator